MTDSRWLLFLLPATVMVGLVCMPNSWANRRPAVIGRAIYLLAAMQFCLAISAAIAIGGGWTTRLQATLWKVSDELPLAITVWIDGVSCLMLTLVSFVGWVICKYSLRYLDGEATQGRYFRWTAFTLGAVSLMVISGNLLMFIVAWVLTSLGLHHLLLHYGHRPAARRAARTKFAISRLGDFALIAAMAILYARFRTLEFSELFAAVAALETAPIDLQVSSFLLVLGAVTKSAQFPFHTWLPQTMETPTPVSALMHAGIVNAGGYLMIRTSPLVAITPWAMTVLAIIGGFTALFAAIVMLTQNSIKKSLAYSTVAQMGFMLLQCGLGAFSAAMLHILAHSLYKAHAFLSSGSVIVDPVRTRRLPAFDRSSLPVLPAIGLSLMLVLIASLTMFGVDLQNKPGGWLLGSVLCLALTHWIGQSLQCGVRSIWIRSITSSVSLCVFYAFSFFAVDRFIGANLPAVGWPALPWLVATFVFAGFIGLFGLQSALARGLKSEFIERWYVHASNGFYFESILRRVFGPLVNT